MNFYLKAGLLDVFADGQLDMTDRTDRRDGANNLAFDNSANASKNEHIFSNTPSKINTAYCEKYTSGPFSFALCVRWMQEAE